MSKASTVIWNGQRKSEAGLLRIQYHWFLDNIELNIIWKAEKGFAMDLFSFLRFEFEAWAKAYMFLQ